MTTWPKPHGGTGRSFLATSPVGERWQNALKRTVYPAYLSGARALGRWQTGIRCLQSPFVMGARGSEFDLLVSEVPDSVIRGGRVLLQGFGSGEEARFWTPFSPNAIVGLDLMPEPEDEAGSSVAAVAGDMRHTPFADSSFDVLASINTSEHVSDMEIALQESARTA